jgi:hypothetical protein
MVSCYYNLLLKIGYDLKDFDVASKQKRNEFIGRLQKNNQKLSNYLISTTNNLIEYYIRINNIWPDNIIYRQRDGLILNKPLTITTSSISLPLRHLISVFIIDVDRSKYLSIRHNGEVVVKGIKNKPQDTSFYNLFKNINFQNKSCLLEQIEYIRQSFLKSTQKGWFTTPAESDRFKIRIVGGTEIIISKSGILAINPDDIDKQYYWKTYVWPFCQSTLLERFI